MNVVASGSELTLVDPYQLAGLAVVVAVPGWVLGEVVADGGVVGGEAVAVAFDCAVACLSQVPDCLLWCCRFGPHRSSFPPIEHQKTRFRRDNMPRAGVFEAHTSRPRAKQGHGATNRVGALRHTWYGLTTF